MTQSDSGGGAHPAPGLPGGVLAPDRDPSAAHTDPGEFRTVVWNDPVNLMSYVVHVFRSYFGYSRPVAEQLMRLVHEEGRAVVSRGSRETVERDVRAMHGFGLRATVERAGQDGDA
ncbi:ATP-dependent Clp protease adapter ClpS [Brachybacterium sp. EF45031]|uniref:ATP-dependent Clp protease adapter ClpS n=1 Tax=Brachybacterium sillae TaxID=2810536 RepID=UPI00217CD630|nr:ATP-dependent Clp protease adapter ClpS [Brachybacterium sillae]MCS6710969.1 ATP-dependent Clp protease adapter ClpS [Brachybacterium sillae]